MVHLALAVGDLMMMLIGSALWVGVGLAAIVAIGLGAFGGLYALARRWRRGGR